MSYTGPFSFTVPQGGTGNATLTDHGMLVGSGTTAVTPLTVGTDGQVMLGATGADPSFGTVTSTSLSFTPGAGSLVIDITAPVSVANGGTGATTLTDHGVLVGSGTAAISPLAVGTDGQVLLGSTGADPVFATITSTSLSFTPGAGTLVIDITAPVSIANGGTNATSMTDTDGVVYFDGTRLVTTAVGTAGYILTSNGAGVAPTFNAVGVAITWQEITAATVNLAVNNGYTLNRVTLITATLPAIAAVNDRIDLVGSGAGGWLLAQNAGQTIHFGAQDTTPGVAGSLASTVRYDCLEVICIVANTDWVVRTSMGNITIV